MLYMRHDFRAEIRLSRCNLFCGEGAAEPLLPQKTIMVAEMSWPRCQMMSVT